jgi:hypothetical protein
MNIWDNQTAAGRCIDEAVRVEATHCFTHRSGKSLLRVCEAESSTSSSRNSKRTVSVRRVGTDAGSCPCCGRQPTDDGVKVLENDDGVVSIAVGKSSGLWAREGESEGDGVPDVMSLHLIQTVPSL